MAVTGNLGNKYTKLYPSGDTIDWLGLDGEVKISAVTGEQAYNIQVRVRIDTDYALWFDPSGKLKITCNGETISNEYDAALVITNKSDVQAYGEWTDWYTFKWDVTSKKSSVKIVASAYLGHIKGEDTDEYGGPDYRSRPGQHFNTLYCSGTFDIDGIEIGKKPSITSLVNNNKYTVNGTTKNGVSADTDSISIKINGDFGDPTATIYWKFANGTNGTKTNNPFTLSNLIAGTTYNISVQLKNSIGETNWHDISIRTRHKNPETSLTLNKVGLESLTFDWTSDKSLASTEYKIGTGSWKDLGKTGTSGSFTVDGFNPNTKHTIHFRGISTTTYDSRQSTSVSAVGTTHDRGRITAIGDCIFGENIDLTITNPSSTALQLKVDTEGNNNASFTISNVTKGTYTFTPTQEQLDKMYKCYTNKNTIPIKFKLITNGTSDWEDDEQEKTLTLTGIAKTAHIGDSNNKPRRCQIWIGDSNNKPRRVVAWVGVDDKPRRTI